MIDRFVTFKSVSMKLFLTFLLLLGLKAGAQVTEATAPPTNIAFNLAEKVTEEKIKLMPQKWTLSRNHLLTGGLIFLAGASKGFNETLEFHWKGFRHMFQDVNRQWFDPEVSWRNKYKNGDPEAGARFPLSTSVFVMYTDQYHLNNFVNKMAWSSAIVIKIGEGKKPFKYYLLDMVYYTACHQAGFAL